MSRNSGNTKSDGGRRNTSLFDLPSNGAAAIARLRGQVRASSPLTSLFGAAEGFSGGVQGAQSRLANLRSSFNRIDNRSRLLIGQSNPNRNPDGFGLQPIQSPSFSLFG
ncbi:MAG: hypothetical protein VX733_13165 [Candidatus Latescibacterota bacterium]|nr:hypothetical protein [Candidatus Latescibacterota bacterium]